MKASAVTVVMGLLLGSGYGVSEYRKAQASEVLPTPPPASQPSAARKTTRPRVANPQPAVARKTPRPQPAARTTPAQLDEAAFWRLIAETRSAAGNDTGRQSELLHERLRQLSPKSIIQFARTRSRLDRRAYTWNLWGAAYVIEDGCSDDCFRDFRGYLISLGPSAYTNALRNPDSLASVVQDAETGNWENADNVAPDAYSSVTGGDFPLDDSDLSGSPRGKPFDDSEISDLVRRYPRLAARFR